jgi:UDP-N-acetylmuramate-alanine ligase
MRKLGKTVYLVNDQSDVAEFLKGIVQSGDLIITMGAGPIWKTAHEVCELLTS